MSRFIWITDKDKKSHYVNVNYIIRVTKVAAHGTYSAYSYVKLNCDGNTNTISLDEEGYDNSNAIISKIQAALA